MNKTLGNNVLRTSAFALACLALGNVGVKAGTMTSSTSALTPLTETYSTTATIGTSGVTNSNGDSGPGPIGFNQITSASFGLNSQVSLGAFAVSTLADGSTTTYKNTPFTLTYNPLSVGGDNFPNKPITISGVLNGLVNGNQSTVKAQFSAISSPVFSTPDGNYLSTISVANNPLSLVPSTSGNGLTTIQASVVTSGPVPAPEPTTLAILATSLVGFGLRRRLRSGRKSA